MVILYHGGGADVTDVRGGYAMPMAEWERVRDAAYKLATVRGATRAIEIVNKYTFELREGTNYFGDVFYVLYASVSVESYAELVEIKADNDSVRALRTLAEAIQELGVYVRFVAFALETNDQVIPVTAPSPRITSEAVDRALQDAEQLIRTTSAANAVDRSHTALHGYLRAMLQRRDVELPNNASITRLFSLLKNSDDVLADLGHRSEEIQQILRSMSSVIDSLNTLRNNASGAHPVEKILDEPEARLAINTIRTLIHYLDQKLEV